MKMKSVQQEAMDTTGRLFSPKQLKKLIIPLILEQTLLITIGVADTMMIASAGEAAVSGVSLVDMFNNLITAVLSALATGGAVVTSQLIGGGKREEACKSAKQLVYTTTLITMGISVVVAIFSRQLIHFFFGSIEQDVFHNALIYLLVSTLYFPFLAIYNSAAALFRSMGNSKITLKVSVYMNIINVCGNAICVLGLGMGVLGVAIPSLISRAVAAFVLYGLLKNPDYIVHIRKEKFCFDKEMVRSILRIGIPGGIENGIFQFGRVIVVSIISGFGTVQIAANGVANSLDHVGCIVNSSLSLAMITVIGQCVGAKDREQVKYFTKKILGIGYRYTALINIPMLLGLPWILKLYSMSPEVNELAYILVMLHNGVAMLIWPLAFVLPNMLRACNDVKYTMVVSIFSMFVFRIGFSYIIGINMGYGAIGVWLAMLIDWCFRTLCFVGRYLSGRWIRTGKLDERIKI